MELQRTVIPERQETSKVTIWSLSSVHLFSRVRLFVTPWTAARQTSLSITNSQSLLKLMSIESMMPSNHLIPIVPFSSYLQSFPASGSFPMSQFFASGGLSIGVSASVSVFPMNIQDWFPLGLTGLICLQSKGKINIHSLAASVNTMWDKYRKQHLGTSYSECG